MWVCILNWTFYLCSRVDANSNKLEINHDFLNTPQLVTFKGGPMEEMLMYNSQHTANFEISHPGFCFSFCKEVTCKTQAQLIPSDSNIEKDSS